MCFSVYELFHRFVCHLRILLLSFRFDFACKINLSLDKGKSKYDGEETFRIVNEVRWESSRDSMHSFLQSELKI